MNFEDAFVDPDGLMEKLKESLSLIECDCHSCKTNNSIIKWHKIPGTVFSVTYFGTFIFDKKYYPNNIFMNHSNYISLEDLMDECPPEIQTALVFNIDILRSKNKSDNI